MPTLFSIGKSLPPVRFIPTVSCGELRGSRRKNLLKCSTRLRKSTKSGYKFGYRHQFGLIAATFGKLLITIDLAGLPITLVYPYFS
jgi:hypothetical protein